jgi:hypothetical protein
MFQVHNGPHLVHCKIHLRNMGQNYSEWLPSIRQVNEIQNRPIKLILIVAAVV